MEIDGNLVAMLGSLAMNDSSVAHFFREAQFPSPNPATTFSEENPCLDDSNEAILLVLTEHPFASIAQLSRLTHLPRSTVYRRLTQSLAFQMRHLR
jgi:transcriptional regulator of acetoin/glycerol metabolism